MGVNMRDAERDAFETIEAESRLHDMPEEATIVNDNMNAEERDILDRFERGELRSAPGVEQEIDAARRAARNTFNKTRRVNLRVTERDFNLAHSRAREEGMPYQTLLSSVIHKYLSGRLAEKRLPDDTTRAISASPATSTSRNRSARWRRYGPTSWRWSGRRRGCWRRSLGNDARLERYVSRGQRDKIAPALIVLCRMKV